MSLGGPVPSMLMESTNTIDSDLNGVLEVSNIPKNLYSHVSQLLRSNRRNSIFLSHSSQKVQLMSELDDNHGESGGD